MGEPEGCPAVLPGSLPSRGHPAPTACLLGRGSPGFRPGPSRVSPLPPSTDLTPTKMKVSKSCVPSCFETVYDGYSKHASTTVCCQYDLCNGASLAVPGAPALLPALLATLWGLL